MGVSPMRCRRCKRTIQGYFLSLSFSQNMDGKRENRQDPRKPEDLLIFLLLSRSMTLAKDIGRSASRCRKRVHHLIHRVQMMLFLWTDYKLHINGGNLRKKRTVSVLLTTCLAAGMPVSYTHLDVYKRQSGMSTDAHLMLLRHFNRLFHDHRIGCMISAGNIC